MDEAYEIGLISDLDCITSFSCGVKPMDDFIQSELEIYTKNHYCSVYYVKPKSGDELAAIFALTFDFLVLDPDDFDDMNTGASETDRPDVDEPYRTRFEEKSVYPALEIAYLAVDHKYQARHLGTAIVDEIVRYAKAQTLAGCVFLTVKAYHTSKYSAFSFYQKMPFCKADRNSAWRGLANV